MTENPNLLKKFYKIIDSETTRTQEANAGTTDVATVAGRVQRLCKPFLNDLLLLLGDIYFKLVIGQRMKRRGSGIRLLRFRRRRKAIAGSETEQQLVFEGMEELRGYPAQLTYEDKPGHVVFVDSRKSREFNREKGEQYLEQLHEWDKQRINFLKTGNRFARQLVKAYGDLPLEELVERWKRDHSPGQEQDV